MSVRIKVLLLFPTKCLIYGQDDVITLFSKGAVVIIAIWDPLTLIKSFHVYSFHTVVSELFMKV